jgi:alpha-beta hydrolase superfamily lysophospholipase
MRFLKRTLRICLVLLIIFNIILAFHAWKFTHFFDDINHRNKRPEQMNAWEKTRMVLFGVSLSKPVLKTFPDVAYETVQLKTGNGLRIEGWWIPAAGSARGTVILLHGYGSTKAAKLPEAMYFRELGYNTFLIDFRAHGNSEGHACSIGYKEAEEVKLAYDHVRSQGSQPLILWGMSMGAAAILKAVPEYQLKPDKLILEAPFATLTDAVKSRMWAVHLPGTPLAQVITFWGGLEQGFWAPGFEPATCGRQVQAPVLLCWGREDIRVMEYETNSIYRQLGSKQKTLVVFEHSGHQSFCRSETEKWKAAVKAFLQ